MVAPGKLLFDRSKRFLASDSVNFNTERGIEELFGKALVGVDSSFMVSADYIRIDRKKHTIFASAFYNSKTKKYTGSPVISMARGNAEADSILYNWETQKSRSWGMRGTIKTPLSR